MTMVTTTAAMGTRTKIPMEMVPITMIVTPGDTTKRCSTTARDMMAFTV